MGGRRWGSSIFILILFFVSFELCAQTPTKLLSLEPEFLIDGVSKEVLKDKAILIEGDRIKDVVAISKVPAHATRQKFPGKTLLPGLIDVHVHLMIRVADYQTDHLQNSSSDKALLALHNAQKLLMRGWTTLRVAGDADVGYGISAARRAIESGLFIGPRIVGANHYISVTGGGGDINHFSHEQHVHPDGVIISGADKMREAVRQEIKYGSDWIKLLVTGAFMSSADNPNDVQMSEEEIRAAVNEAKMRNVPVMAHAHSAEGIKMAIRAGVRSIEHGTFIDDEGIALLVKNGVYLVPTQAVGEYCRLHFGGDPAKNKMLELEKRIERQFQANISKAIKAGVKIAVGSDLGGYEDSKFLTREIMGLVERGMTPMAAIQSATRVNAELLRLDSQIGTVQAGKMADLLLIEGNPILKMEALNQVVKVFRSGREIQGCAGSLTAL